MNNILVYNWLCVIIDLTTLIIKNCVDTRTSSTHGNLHALASYPAHNICVHKVPGKNSLSHLKLKFNVNQFIIRAINNSEIINNSLSKFNEIKTIWCRKLSKMYSFGAVVLAIFFFLTPMA
jgi:hypothetical protein